MTREEAYAEGFQTGRRWAERDIANRHTEEETIRWNTTQEWKRRKDTRYELLAAEALGQARGYRDTWARWEDGRLTWEMFEHAPVGK